MSLIKLVSDETPVNLTGYSITVNLKDSLEGEYRVATRAGMLVNCNIIIHLKAAVQSGEKEFPLSVENKLNDSGVKKIVTANI